MELNDFHVHGNAVVHFNSSAVYCSFSGGKIALPAVIWIAYKLQMQLLEDFLQLIVGNPVIPIFFHYELRYCLWRDLVHEWTVWMIIIDSWTHLLFTILKKRFKELTQKTDLFMNGLFLSPNVFTIITMERHTLKSWLLHRSRWKSHAMYNNESSKMWQIYKCMAT